MRQNTFLTTLGIVLWGFFVWKRAARVEAPTGGGPNLAEEALVP